MSPSKRQSIISIGIALIVLSAFLFYYALSRPKVNETPLEKLQSSISSTVLSKSESFSSSSSSIDTTVLNASTSQETTSHLVNYPINLNTCTVDDLTSIDGIGEARAQAIMEYRDYLGGYTSVSQIKDIKGIGDGIYAKIEPYLTV